MLNKFRWYSLKGFVRISFEHPKYIMGWNGSKVRGTLRYVSYEGGLKVLDRYKKQRMEFGLKVGIPSSNMLLVNEMS